MIIPIIAVFIVSAFIITIAIKYKRESLMIIVPLCYTLILGGITFFISSYIVSAITYLIMLFVKGAMALL